MKSGGASMLLSSARLALPSAAPGDGALLHRSIVFRGVGTGEIDSFADLVEDPATQLVVATPDLLA